MAKAGKIIVYIFKSEVYLIVNSAHTRAYCAANYYCACVLSIKDQWNVAFSIYKSIST